jgi:hypothetical protein
MKINWGTGIIITLVIFVGGIGLLIWISYHQQLNLVTEDYYPAGIKYEQHIQKIKNTTTLTTPVTLKMASENIELQFPMLDSLSFPKGEIQVFRPSDNRLDKFYNIEVQEDRVFRIPLKDLTKGIYMLKIDWNQDSLGYYQEFNLSL